MIVLMAFLALDQRTDELRIKLGLQFAKNVRIKDILDLHDRNERFALFVRTSEFSPSFYVVVPHVVFEAVFADRVQTLVQVGEILDVVDADWFCAGRVCAWDALVLQLFDLLIVEKVLKLNRMLDGFAYFFIACGR